MLERDTKIQGILFCIGACVYPVKLKLCDYHNIDVPDLSGIQNISISPNE